MWQDVVGMLRDVMTTAPQRPAGPVPVPIPPPTDGLTDDMVVNILAAACMRAELHDGMRCARGSCVRCVHVTRVHFAHTAGREDAKALRTLVDEVHVQLSSVSGTVARLETSDRERCVEGARARTMRHAMPNAG